MLTKTKINLIHFASFLILAIFSYWIATKNYFWGDESYSFFMVTKFPWSDFLTGHTYEGNPMPLYFVLLKVVSSFVRHLPLILDPIFLLRSLAIIPMAVAGSLITRDAIEKSQSPLFAILLFLGIMSSTAYLGYSWQARPYGLWFLASTLFARALCSAKPTLRELIFSAVFLYSVTSFSLFEVGMGLTIIGLLNIKNLRPFMPLFALGVIGSIYVLFCIRSNAPFLFTWPGLFGFVPLIIAHLRPWAILFLFIYFIAEFKKTRERKRLMLFSGGLGLLLGAVILAFYSHKTSNGFEISNRYFLFCLPQLLVALIYFRPVNIPKKINWVLNIGACLFSLAFIVKITKDYNITQSHFLPSQGVAFREFLKNSSDCYCLNTPADQRPHIHFWGSYLPMIHQHNGLEVCSQWLGLNIPNVGLSGNVQAQLNLTSNKFAQIEPDLSCK